MADGDALAEAVAIQKAKYRVAGYSAYQGPAGGYFGQLHTATPGPTGMVGVANAGHRVAIPTWVVDVLTGIATPSADPVWSSVTATYDGSPGHPLLSDVTLWDDLTNTSLSHFKRSGVIPGGGSVTIGNDFTVPKALFSDAYLIAG